MLKKIGFTLAEVLITLAIIGVVAALTIPTLIAHNQQRGWDTAATVFERKLEESLKIMNTQETLAGYSSTEDFVNELSKHLKITKICKNDNLSACFEDKVIWNILDISSGTESKTINISSVKTSADLGKSDWDTNVVGILLNNGTTGIIAYNPSCKQDSYNNQITGTSCVSMIYDTSGFAKPNTSNKDVRGFNSSLDRCKFKSNGTCFGIPFKPEPMTFAECTGGVGTPETDTPAGKEAKSLGIKNCYYANDYWAGAVKACGGTDKMPTAAQLASIANYIYETDEIGAKTNWDCPNYINCRNDDKVSAIGGFTINSSNYFFVWSGEESSSNIAYYRGFSYADARWSNGSRSHNYGHMFCLVD